METRDTADLEVDLEVCATVCCRLSRRLRSKLPEVGRSECGGIGSQLCCPRQVLRLAPQCPRTAALRDMAVFLALPAAVRAFCSASRGAATVKCVQGAGRSLGLPV